MTSTWMRMDRTAPLGYLWATDIRSAYSVHGLMLKGGGVVASVRLTREPMDSDPLSLPLVWELSLGLRPITGGEDREALMSMAEQLISAPYPKETP